MEPRFYAAFEEGRGIVIGVTSNHAEPVLWFKTVSDFDKFLDMLRKFRGSVNYVPDVFRKAFGEG